MRVRFLHNGAALNNAELWLLAFGFYVTFRSHSPTADFATVDAFFSLERGQAIVRYGFATYVHDVVVGFGREWVTSQWLSSVLNFWAWQFGGMVLVALLRILLLAVALGLAVRAYQSASHTAPLLLLLGVFVHRFSAGFSARSEAFVDPIFVLFLCALVRSDRRARWSEVALLAGWINLHGSALFGFLLAGLVALERIWRTRKNLMEEIGFVVARTLALCATPYGARTLLSGLEQAERDRHIAMDEWQSPLINGRWFLATLCVVLVLSVAHATWRTRAIRTEYGVILLLAVLGVYSSRFLVFFGLALVAYGPVLSTLWPTLRLPSSRIFRPLAVLFMGVGLLGLTRNLVLLPRDLAHNLPPSLAHEILRTASGPVFFVEPAEASWYRLYARHERTFSERLPYADMRYVLWNVRDREHARALAGGDRNTATALGIETMVIDTFIHERQTCFVGWRMIARSEQLILCGALTKALPYKDLPRRT